MSGTRVMPGLDAATPAGLSVDEVSLDDLRPDPASPRRIAEAESAIVCGRPRGRQAYEGDGLEGVRAVPGRFGDFRVPSRYRDGR